jgi:flagellar protein FliL
MSEAPEKEEDTVATTEGSPSEEELAKTKAKLRKKRVIIVAVIAVIAITLIGVGIMMLTKKKPADGASTHAEATSPDAHNTEDSADATGSTSTKTATDQPIYLDLDEFLVNLNSKKTQPSFLKMSISIEVDSEENKNIIKANMPKIRDSFMMYLREVRSEDLQGSAGVYRLKEELLFRINKVMYPIQVNDVLFREILVQ